MAAAETRAWRLIAAASVIAVIVRLVFGLTYWVGKPLTHDEREYLALARSLSEGRGFAYAPDHESGTAQQFGRAPAYPMFLAAIGATEPHNGSAPARVKIAQALLGAALAYVVAAIAMRAASPRAAATAAFICAVYPPLVVYSAYVLSESLYSLIALTSALVLQIAVARSDDAHSSRAGGPLALLAGALIGVAVLIRPAMLVFVPLALLWLIRRRRHVLAIAMLAAVVAVVAPWTARNYRVYGRFVLVASEGGVTFWTGNHPLSRGEGDLAANPEIKRAELDFRRSHQSLSAEELEPLYYRDAIRQITDNPGWWAGLVARKAWFTFVPVGPSYSLHSARYRAMSIVPYLLLLPFAIYGVRRLRHAAEPPAALALLVCSSVLVCLIFFPQERFRVPILDPALIVAAAAAGGRRTEL
jgi:4-amino-4-deoxy-L-arabinose transferase-like glycosyltransferase